ncbi:NmrA family protein [Sorangium cellulosum]|uniref:NmrA family protein n=1 Tax=Sorangium cellulosum TaxID=56 RepID=A0A2L0EK66_SORCE|nr:NmrA family NAD(P)-binding protein [Sorangium cellulosum]AUX39697.1 NmrA family protein [Sorangium cellulosum]
MAIPTILVFGATGKIGGALLDALLPDHAAGRVKLVAAVRRPDAAPAFEARGIEARLIDLDLAETRGLEPLVGALRGVDRVFLLTGYDVKMIAQSKAAIDAARAAGASQIVHLGVHASPDTTIVHFAWHQVVEAYLDRSGVDATHLRPTSFMQNLPLLLQVGGGEPGVLRHYIGDAQTSWIDTGDIARVAAVVLREPKAHAGRAYGLGTEAASMPEIAALIAAVTGLPWRYEAREPAEFLRAMTALGADPVYMACVRNVFERTRNGSLKDAADTFDTVQRVTGRAPITLREYVEKNRAVFSYEGRPGDRRIETA